MRISEYNKSAANRKCQKKLHSESCRAVKFSTTGDALLTGSADKSLVILDTATNKRQRTQQDAHPAGLTRLAELAEQCFASGPILVHQSCNAVNGNLHESTSKV